MSWYIRMGRRLRSRPIRLVAAVSVLALAAAGTAAAVGTHVDVAPSNQSLPTISGTAAAGGTLTADPGTWNGSSPMSFQYQWLICDGNGNACHDIAGATAQSYQVKSSDAGNTVKVTVIASNSDGSSSALSAASAKLAATSSAPAVASAPAITGSAAVGGSLTASPGTWTGAAPITFQYQWLICDGNGNACHDIAGASAQTYAVQGADAGNTLRVRVTAANSSGSSAATSNPSAKVTTTPAAAPATTGCPARTAGLESVAVSQVVQPARLQIDRFQLVSGPITRAMSSFQVRVHVSDTCGDAVQGASVYTTAVPYDQVNVPAETTTDASGWTTITFNRAAGFPASRTQQLMVLFVRARRPGDPVLAGISTRRLISLPVRLDG